MWTKIGHWTNSGHTLNKDKQLTKIVFCSQFQHLTSVQLLFDHRESGLRSYPWLANSSLVAHIRLTHGSLTHGTLMAHSLHTHGSLGARKWLTNYLLFVHPYSVQQQFCPEISHFYWWTKCGQILDIRQYQDRLWTLTKTWQRLYIWFQAQGPWFCPPKFAPVAGKSCSFIASMSHMWATSELLAINQVSLPSQLTKSVN